MPTPPDTTTEAAAPVATTEAPDQHVPLLIQQLYKSGITEDKPDEIETPPEKPEAKKTTDKPDAAKPGDKPADEPPLKLRTEKPVRPTFKFEEPAKPEPKAAPVEPAKPDPKWEAGLEESEKEMLEDARYLEKRFPDKYKGYASRTEKFLRDHAAYVTQAGDDFDQASPEYKAFLEKNQPRLTRAEIREVEATRVTDRVNKEWEGKHSDLQHKLFVRDEEPKIEQESRQVWAELTQTALPEDVAKHLQEMVAKHGPEKGVAEAKKTYGLEIDVATAVLTAATEDIKEFVRLNRKDPETGRPLTRPAQNPSDKGYEQHSRLGQAIADICADFKATAPVDQQFKNGKWFVTRDEFNRLVPADRAKAWSFSNPEIVQRMKVIAKTSVTEAIKQRLAYVEGTGFKRTPPVVVKEDTRKPEETRRSPGPAMAPASSDGAPVVDAQVTALMGALNKEP